MILPPRLGAKIEIEKMLSFSDISKCSYLLNNGNKKEYGVIY